MFEPHLKNFYVGSFDPSHIKILKLEIITNLVTKAKVAAILREFQSYITGQDKVCIATTIQVKQKIVRAHQIIPNLALSL